MTRKKVYLIVQTFLCVLLVILLSCAAVRIFREGSARNEQNPLEAVYTREAVADAFADIAPVLFVSVGIAAAGLLLGVRDDEKQRTVRDARAEADFVEARLSGTGDAVKKERAGARRVKLLGWAVFGLCMIPVLLYVTRGAHFPERDLEGMIHGLAAGVFPWIGAGIAALMGAGILEERSLRRELEAAKTQLAAEKAAGEGMDAEETEGGGSLKAENGPEGTSKRQGFLQAAVIVAAVLLLILGAGNGSMTDVLVKAAAICTECVGLG